MRNRSRPRRLSAADWEEAALRAIARGGIGAVAVEPLAEELRVSKGSFYWHFRDRAALLRAALARWQRRETEAAIAAFEELPSPRARMSAALRAGLRGELGGAIDAALFLDGNDAAVLPWLRKVTAARLAYTTRLYRAMGMPPRRAAAQARLAYAAYIGHFVMQRAAPVRPAPSFIEHVVETLVPKR